MKNILIILILGIAIVSCETKNKKVDNTSKNLEKLDSLNLLMNENAELSKKLSDTYSKFNEAINKINKLTDELDSINKVIKSRQVSKYQQDFGK